MNILLQVTHKWHSQDLKNVWFYIQFYYHSWLCLSNSPTWPNASLVHRLYKHPTAVPGSGTNDIKDSASCRQASTCLVLPLMEGFTLFSIHGNSFCIPILDCGLGATWVDPALRWVPTPSPLTAPSGFQQGIPSTCQPSMLEKPRSESGS